MTTSVWTADQNNKRPRNAALLQENAGEEALGHNAGAMQELNKGVGIESRKSASCVGRETLPGIRRISCSHRE